MQLGVRAVDQAAKIPLLNRRLDAVRCAFR
jgi:hypothetical protein